VPLRRGTLIALLLAALVGGCSEEDVPQVEDPRKQEAVERCREEARKIEDPAARDTALAACEGDREKTEERARRQCLEIARQIPEGPARERAEQGCERVGQ